MIDNMEKAETGVISVPTVYPNGTQTVTISDVKNIPRTVEVPLELPASPVDPNEALAEELRGKMLQVPCMMKTTMDGWPVRERNRWENQMRILFNDTLDR